MKKTFRITCACITSALLVFSLGNAHAALVNYSIEGSVLVSGGFGLSAGNTITATGTFDDIVLTAGTGLIDFSAGSGNTMTIFVGTETFTASNDIDYNTASPDQGPFINLFNFATDTLDGGDFDFQATINVNGAPATFNSNGDFFDDLSTTSLFGQWGVMAITPVPVPAAVWLFGSGLLGLIGVSRKKKV